MKKILKQNNVFKMTGSYAIHSKLKDGEIVLSFINKNEKIHISICIGDNSRIIEMLYDAENLFCEIKKIKFCLLCDSDNTMNVTMKKDLTNCTICIVHACNSKLDISFEVNKNRLIRVLTKPDFFKYIRKNFYHDNIISKTEKPGYIDYTGLKTFYVNPVFAQRSNIEFESNEDLNKNNNQVYDENTSSKQNRIKISIDRMSRDFEHNENAKFILNSTTFLLNFICVFMWGYMAVMLYVITKNDA